ncbi:10755_t:CDS:1, partial [Racocetra fulgida]
EEAAEEAEESLEVVQDIDILESIFSFREYKKEAAKEAIETNNDIYEIGNIKAIETDKTESNNMDENDSIDENNKMDENENMDENNNMDENFKKIFICTSCYVI